MAEEGLSTKVTQGNRNPQGQRKNLESFVPWKDATALERRQGSAMSLASKSGRGNGRKEIFSASISSPVAPRRSKSYAEGTRFAEPVSMSIRTEGGRRLQSGSQRKERTNGGETSAAKKQNPNDSVNDDSRNGRASLGNQALSVERRLPAKEFDSSLRALPTNRVSTVVGGARLDRGGFQYPNSGRLQPVVVQGRRSRIPGQDSAVLNMESKSGSAGIQHQVSIVSRKRPSLETFEDDEQLLTASADDCDDVALESPHGHSKKQPEAIHYHSEESPEASHYDKEESPEASHFLNEEDNEDVTMESCEETTIRNVVPNGGLHEAEDTREMQITLVEETEKRRLRRQAQSAREKEGVRRKKEGLPRNFLLVDEYTQMPYSVGVGDWRKELMLLSRNLDPAIGNINQQPEGAVAEIAEWIQHTWEYSSPVKFAYVKEVIARGVTLRRAELWKKIRNNEPKPDKLSDRSWRILQRQLESPATIRKSQSCSKANASRMNFGRTGPSGEVGVRERLRRTLRRSPDPEEIQYEMARDKGYGGRYKRKFEELNVMHGRGVEGHLPAEVPKLTGYVGNVNYNTMLPYDDFGHDVHVRDHGNDENLANGGIAETLKVGGVQALSESEIAQHPVVMKMMERLEALEARYTVCEEDQNVEDSEKCTVAAGHGEVEAATIDKRSVVLQDNVEGHTNDRQRKIQIRAF